MKIPRNIGRYEIIEEIGRGAMGRIYLAHDPKINRRVAIKTIHAFESLSPGEAQEMSRRFAREAQAAGRLQHPGVVTIFDVGEQDGRFFIAMEYIEGDTLEAYTRPDGLLPVAKVVDLMARACETLDYAHRSQIVHRDIKPANLMLLPDGSLKIMDFGLAKNPATALTQDGILVGTPNYMSPEQVRGRPLDGRSDIFSLSAVMYEMLTGTRPFAGDSVTTIIYRILNESPRHPEFLNAAVPTAIGKVLMKGLEKDPAQRFQSGRQFAEALQGQVVAQAAASMAVGGAMASAITMPMPGTAGVGRIDFGHDAAPDRQAPGAPERGARPPAAIAAGPSARRAQAAAASDRSRARPSFLLLAAIALVLLFPAGGSLEDRWGLGGDGEAQPFYRTAAILAAGGGTPSPGEPATQAPPLPPVAVPGGVEQVAHTILSDPPGATIYVDDVEVAGGVIHLPADDQSVHTVVAEDECHIEKTEVRFSAGETVTIPLKTPKAADVEVASTPPGARVVLDGRATGLRTPARITLTLCGAHDVVLGLDGYKDAKRALKGADGPLSLALERIPKGFVRIAAAYPVEVIEGGRTLGSGGDRIALESGRHDLVVRNRDLFVEKRVTVNVPADKTVTPDLNLPGIGTITVLTSPGNCRIFVNDREIGVPPINDHRLAAGTHTVRAVYVPTGETKESTVTIVAGGSARVPFKFSP